RAEPGAAHPRLARGGGGTAGARGGRGRGGALPPGWRRPARRALTPVEICLSAPGKLFLSREDSVLLGGTARLAGVGPPGFALAGRGEDREVHLVLAEGRLRGTVTPLGVHWASEPAPAFAFAARALDVVVRARGRESLGLELALSPTAPGPDGHKLGLGSS